MSELSWQLKNAQKRLQMMREQHGGAPVRAADGPGINGIATEFVVIPSAQQKREQDAVNHHGDIALAALREGRSSHYQLWLAMRVLDVVGSGRLVVEDVKERMTRESSELFLYRWPRLWQLLREGDGLLWCLGGDRIWLYSTARVAYGFGVQRLNGRFCTIVKDDVFGRVAVFRAHCFAAWLANHTNPMSQRTIEKLTGIRPRTQRRYCQLVGIEVRRNISIGPSAKAADRQMYAWMHGNIFEFTDFQGQQGPAYRRYIAWHLPASYVVDAVLGSRRQQKRQNQRIGAGLAQTETPGNGANVELRLFYVNGKAAAKAANRRMLGVPTIDIYWQQRRAKTGTGIWNVMEGLGC